uniref:Uncharacterized protein n=1 Tax=viral metagenome TaxID=1070528 RepID=A0A6H1ZLX9_9ZZZZ
MPFTVFCEQAIDKKTEEKKVEKLQPRIIDIWGADIESMPLVPELQWDQR